MAEKESTVFVSPRNGLVSPIADSSDEKTLKKIAVAPASGVSKMKLTEDWLDALESREKSLFATLMANPEFRKVYDDGAGVVEIRASEDDRRNALLPNSSVVVVNSSQAALANAAVSKLNHDLSLIIIRNTLQFLPEVRRFLRICFEKTVVGGLLVVTVPHQFLYERKLRLPSRRNGRHRRFYTVNTLFADLEEAVDPSEFRVRALIENDYDYDYRRTLDEAPEGGQDIVLILEHLRLPDWRPRLDVEDTWARKPLAELSTRIVQVSDHERERVTYKIAYPDQEPVRRILLIKLDHRGDFLMANDAFAMMRKNFFDADITLVCGSWNQNTAEQSGYFNKVIPFDFFPEDDSARTVALGRDSLLKEFEVLMLDETYDLAVDLRVYDDTKDILKIVHARHKAGFDRVGDFPWLSIRLNVPSATVDDAAEQGLIRAESFHNGVGKHRTFEIRNDDTLRFPDRKSLIWGPYSRFKPGSYEFEVFIEPLLEPFLLPFDLVARKGTITLTAGALDVDGRSQRRIWITIPEGVDDLEIRLLSHKNMNVEPFRFSGVRYRRYSAGTGVHQRENMALLAELVRLRLRDPFLMALS